MKTTIAALIISTVTALGQGYLNFTWDPNTEPDLDGYYFYTQLREPQPDGSIKITGLTKDTVVAPPYRKDALLPNKSYQFFITAFNTNKQESDPSSILIIDTPVEPVTAPAGLSTVIDLVKKAATISWSPNPSAESVIRYELKLTDIATQTPIEVRTTDTAVTLTIDPAVYYQLDLTAVNILGRAVTRTMIFGKLSAPKRLIFEGKITWELE